MSYTLKTVQGNKYIELGIDGYRVAQQEALLKAKELQTEVVVINDDDNSYICIAVLHQGEPHLTLCTSGITDDPSIG